MCPPVSPTDYFRGYRYGYPYGFTTSNQQTCFRYYTGYNCYNQDCELVYSEDKYCWTNSYSHISPIGGLGWYQCVPIGYGDEGWHAIEQRNMRYVNPPPVCPGCPYTCGESISVLTSVGGEPCQAQRRG